MNQIASTPFQKFLLPLAYQEVWQDEFSEQKTLHQLLREHAFQESEGIELAPGFQGRPWPGDIPHEAWPGHTWSFSLAFTLIPIGAILIILLALIKVIRNQNLRSSVYDNTSQNVRHQPASQRNQTSRDTYDLQCPHCGAKATNTEDLSPSGDLRCEYCQTWFNVKS